MSKFDLKLNVAKNYSFIFSRDELKKIAKDNPEIEHFSYRGISPHNQVSSFPSVLGGNAYESMNYQNLSTSINPSIPS